MVANIFENNISLDGGGLVGFQHRKQLLKSKKHKCHIKTLQETVKIKLSSTKLPVTGGEQADYNIKRSSMVTRPRLTSPDSHKTLHVFSPNDTGAIRYDSQAPLFGSSLWFTQYTCKYNAKKSRKTKSNNLAVRLYFMRCATF